MKKLYAAIQVCIRIVGGLILGALTLMCLPGSLVMLLNPPPNDLLFGLVFGSIWVMACFWLLYLTVRVLFNWRLEGGIFSPTVLNLISWFYLAMPVIGVLAAGYTGYVFRPLTGSLQAAAYVLTFFGIRKLARFRRDKQESDKRK